MTTIQNRCISLNTCTVWYKRIPSKNLENGIKDIDAIFLCGRDIASYSTKTISPALTPKGSRNFLLNFGHPNISFAQVVIKRNIKVFHEGKSLCLTGAETIQQVSSLALFFSAPSPFLIWIFWWERILIIPSLKNLFVELFKLFNSPAGKIFFSRQLAGINFRFNSPPDSQSFLVTIFVFCSSSKKESALLNDARYKDHDHSHIENKIVSHHELLGH